MKRIKYISPAILLLLNSMSTFAQTAVAQKNGAAFPPWAFDTSNYIILGLCTILLITIYVLYKVNMVLLNVISPKSVVSVVPAEVKVHSEKKPGMLRKLYLKMIDSVPVEQEKDVLLDHDYDGIKELDNNLPPWWKWGFYFTIVFAVVYLLYYHVSGVGKLQEAEYEEEVQIAAQKKAARLLASTDLVNEETVVVLNDAEGVSKGKETFEKLCAACHRTDGGGQVGPNLTDEYWIHGGGIKNVFKVVTYGVPTKGMISWQTQLSPKQIQQVSSYILTLKGTNPPGPKEPQGDIWQEEKTAAPDSLQSDTTAVKDKVAALSTANDKK